MEYIEEIQGLLTSDYEPKKKTLYVELHNRVFFLEPKLDLDCKFCGSKAFYKLHEYLTKNNTMAKTEVKTDAKFELINPDQIATVKLFDRRVILDKDSDQTVLEAAYKAGHTLYVKKVGE